MFESVLWLLFNRYVAPYILGFSAKDLRVSFWSGHVEFNNFQLNTDALSSLNLPVRVCRGFVRRLVVTLPPWTALLSESMTIEVFGVDLHLEPSSSYHPDDAAAATAGEDSRPASPASSHESTASVAAGTAAAAVASSPSSQAESATTSDSYINTVARRLMINARIRVSELHATLCDSTGVLGDVMHLAIDQLQLHPSAASSAAGHECPQCQAFVKMHPHIATQRPDDSSASMFHRDLLVSGFAVHMEESVDAQADGSSPGSRDSLGDSSWTVVGRFAKPGADVGALPPPYRPSWTHAIVSNVQVNAVMTYERRVGPDGVVNYLTACGVGVSLGDGALTIRDTDLRFIFRLLSIASDAATSAAAVLVRSPSSVSAASAASSATIASSVASGATVRSNATRMTAASSDVHASVLPSDPDVRLTEEELRTVSSLIEEAVGDENKAERLATRFFSLTCSAVVVRVVQHVEYADPELGVVHVVPRALLSAAMTRSVLHAVVQPHAYLVHHSAANVTIEDLWTPATQFPVLFAPRWTNPGQPAVQGVWTQVQGQHACCSISLSPSECIVQPDVLGRLSTMAATIGSSGTLLNLPLRLSVYLDAPRVILSEQMDVSADSDLVVFELQSADLELVLPQRHATLSLRSAQLLMQSLDAFRAMQPFRSGQAAHLVLHPLDVDVDLCIDDAGVRTISAALPAVRMVVHPDKLHNMMAVLYQTQQRFADSTADVLPVSAMDIMGFHADATAPSTTAAAPTQRPAAPVVSADSTPSASPDPAADRKAAADPIGKKSSAGAESASSVCSLCFRVAGAGKAASVRASRPAVRHASDTAVRCRWHTSSSIRVGEIARPPIRLTFSFQAVDLVLVESVPLAGPFAGHFPSASPFMMQVTSQHHASSAAAASQAQVHMLRPLAEVRLRQLSLEITQSLVLSGSRSTPTDLLRIHLTLRDLVVLSYMVSTSTRGDDAVADPVVVLCPLAGVGDAASDRQHGMPRRRGVEDSSEDTASGVDDTLGPDTLAAIFYDIVTPRAAFSVPSIRCRIRARAMHAVYEPEVLRAVDALAQQRQRMIGVSDDTQRDLRGLTDVQVRWQYLALRLMRHAQVVLLGKRRETGGAPAVRYPHPHAWAAAMRPRLRSSQPHWLSWTELYYYLQAVLSHLHVSIQQVVVSLPGQGSSRVAAPPPPVVPRAGSASSTPPMLPRSRPPGSPILARSRRASLSADSAGRTPSRSSMRGIIDSLTPPPSQMASPLLPFFTPAAVPPLAAAATSSAAEPPDAVSSHLDLVIDHVLLMSRHRRDGFRFGRLRLRLHVPDARVYLVRGNGEDPVASSPHDPSNVGSESLTHADAGYRFYVRHLASSGVGRAAVTRVAVLESVSATITRHLNARSSAPGVFGSVALAAQRISVSAAPACLHHLCQVLHHTLSRGSASTTKQPARHVPSPPPQPQPSPRIPVSEHVQIELQVGQITATLLPAPGSDRLYASLSLDDLRVAVTPPAWQSSFQLHTLTITVLGGGEPLRLLRVVNASAEYRMAMPAGRGEPPIHELQLSIAAVLLRVPIYEWSEVTALASLLRSGLAPLRRPPGAESCHGRRSSTLRTLVRQVVQADASRCAAMRRRAGTSLDVLHVMLVDSLRQTHHSLSLDVRTIDVWVAQGPQPLVLRSSAILRVSWRDADAPADEAVLRCPLKLTCGRVESRDVQWTIDVTAEPSRVLLSVPLLQFLCDAALLLADDETSGAAAADGPGADTDDDAHHDADTDDDDDDDDDDGDGTVQVAPHSQRPTSAAAAAVLATAAATEQPILAHPMLPGAGARSNGPTWRLENACASTMIIQVHVPSTRQHKAFSVQTGPVLRNSAVELDVSSEDSALRHGIQVRVAGCAEWSSVCDVTIEPSMDAVIKVPRRAPRPPHRDDASSLAEARRARSRWLAQRWLVVRLCVRMRFLPSGQIVHLVQLSDFVRDVQAAARPAAPTWMPGNIRIRIPQLSVVLADEARVPAISANVQAIVLSQEAAVSRRTLTWTATIGAVDVCNHLAFAEYVVLLGHRAEYASSAGGSGVFRASASRPMAARDASDSGAQHLRLVSVSIAPMIVNWDTPSHAVLQNILARCATGSLTGQQRLRPLHRRHRRRRAYRRRRTAAASGAFAPGTQFFVARIDRFAMQPLHLTLTWHNTTLVPRLFAPLMTVDRLAVTLPAVATSLSQAPGAIAALVARRSRRHFRLSMLLFYGSWQLLGNPTRVLRLLLQGLGAVGRLPVQGAARAGVLGALAGLAHGVAHLFAATGDAAALYLTSVLTALARAIDAAALPAGHALARARQRHYLADYAERDRVRVMVALRQAWLSCLAALRAWRMAPMQPRQHVPAAALAVSDCLAFLVACCQVLLQRQRPQNLPLRLTAAPEPPPLDTAAAAAMPPLLWRCIPPAAVVQHAVRARVAASDVYVVVVAAPLPELLIVALASLHDSGAGTLPRAPKPMYRLPLASLSQLEALLECPTQLRLCFCADSRSASAVGSPTLLPSVSTSPRLLPASTLPPPAIPVAAAAAAVAGLASPRRPSSRTGFDASGAASPQRRRPIADVTIDFPSAEDRAGMLLQLTLL